MNDSVRKVAVTCALTLAVVAGAVPHRAGAQQAPPAAAPTDASSAVPAQGQGPGSPAPSVSPANPPATAPPQNAASTNPIPTFLQSSPQYSGVDLLAQSPNFSILTKAIAAAGLTSALRGPGPFTIFAPTDAAFGRMPDAALARLMSPAGKPALIRLLQYHVVPRRLLSDRVRAGRYGLPVATLAGDPLTLQRSATGIVTVNSANILQRDIEVENGVVHVIDTVLTPRRRSPPDRPTNATQ